MLHCEGHPDGHCPDNRNDNTVRHSQGNLMLCWACNKYCFLPIHDTWSSKPSKQSATVRMSAGKKDCDQIKLAPVSEARSDGRDDE